MYWIRSRLKRASGLALFALAVQLALSFGHFHGLASADRLSVSAAISVSIDSANSAVERSKPATPHKSDQDSNDFCAICAVMAMASAALCATPPSLPLPTLFSFNARVEKPEAAPRSSVRVAFQPRGPPAS